MATRSIVTSQPDVACDVCERRLLRGEHSDVFLTAGERRTVCELCAPRATNEGWLRESDHDAVSAPALRPRRGRSLFDRLRLTRRAGDGPMEVAAAPDPSERGRALGYEFLDGFSGNADDSLAGAHQEVEMGEESAPSGAGRPQGGSVNRAGGGRAERAVELFNAGEQPRRVSALTRSLGAPDVSVRPDEDVENLVTIVLAWELCWYRYEIDLDEQGAAVRTLAQGTELGELPHEDRLANAVASELGALSMSPA
jgi:hypothetical protein